MRRGTVSIVNRAGSSRGPTSFQRSGIDTRAPATGRTLNGATSSLPCPFCRKSR